MVKVSKKKISECLKTTLMNVGYVSWEKGELYLDTTSSNYALLMPDRYNTWNNKTSPNKLIRPPHHLTGIALPMKGSSFHVQLILIRSTT